MGYEVSMYVVKPYGMDFGGPPTGSEIAFLELSKIGDGPLSRLFQTGTKKAEGEPPFALWPRNPDDQREGVKFLRENCQTELADKLEDGVITTDPYGDFLGVHDFDATLKALEEEVAEDDYRRFRWALALLRSIKETSPDDKFIIVTYGH